MAQNQVSEMQNRWDMQNEAPWQNLMRYLGVVNPLAGIGGTTTATGPDPSKQNATNQGLGSLLMLASMFA
jgi:hypothetical protein